MTDANGVKLSAKFLLKLGAPVPILQGRLEEIQKETGMKGSPQTCYHTLLDG